MENGVASWLLSITGTHGDGSWLLNSNENNGAGSLPDSNGDNGAGSWLLGSTESLCDLCTSCPCVFGIDATSFV